MLQKQGKMMQNFIQDKLILVESGEEKCKPNHFYGYGSRAFYLIHYIVSGQGKLYANGKVYNLSAGQSFIIKPYQKVKYIADENNPWHYVWVNFSGEIGESIINSSSFSICQTLDKKQDMLELFKRVANSISESVAISNLLVLLNTYATVYPIAKKEEENVVSSVKKYITANFHKSTLSVEGIANSVGVDRSDLFRKFKKATGKSIKTYITEKRMDFAYTLLSRGSSIKESAYSVGFCDPLYFSKAFYKFFGKKASEIKQSKSIKD